ncbi:hypothetical protein [Acetobacter cerevisiae]|uniref:hypothetical protein n=1 Tax=Acetobacter cerevisiae TaxID=178900 RepID=UPI00209D7FD4|nr:hypothetical protein [Acetobacter cerevisiae]MCP1256935.1 hypothetical protein [Acetobacter cerevisiae]
MSHEEQKRCYAIPQSLEEEERVLFSALSKVYQTGWNMYILAMVSVAPEHQKYFGQYMENWRLSVYSFSRSILPHTSNSSTPH